MADRMVENATDEVPEFPEILERVLVFALDEGKEKMEQGEEVIPFTTLVVKDNLFIETHPGENADQCFAMAKHTVEGARGADAYAFCYDGYVETDEGMQDALIAEGGIPGEEIGYAICYLYEIKEDESVEFEADPAYVGESPNFMSELKEADEYTEDELNDDYFEDENENEEENFIDEVKEELSELKAEVVEEITELKEDIKEEIDELKQKFAEK